MKRMIAIVFTCALLIGLCACQKPQESNDPTQITTTPTQTQPTKPAPTETQPTQPVDPRIAEMQELFDHKSDYLFYNTALTSVYENPADVDLAFLFYNGFRDESQQPTEEELVLLEGKMGKYWKEMDLIRLPAGKMDAVLTDLFGITLEQTNGVGLDRLVYLEETDCYYASVTGMHYTDITVINVSSQEDGRLLVQYSTYPGEFVVCLMPKPDGGYSILSNANIAISYTEAGVRNTIDQYFQQREGYLAGRFSMLYDIVPGIVSDEALHLAAIKASDVEWLHSEIVIDITGIGDTYAEAVVTETVTFRVNGAEETEEVVHKILLGLSNMRNIVIAYDGYQEVTTGFTSCSYVPPELW